MECIPKHPILEFSPNALNDVRKLYDLDKPERLDEAIDILDSWVKKQSHFNKKDFSRDYLERTLITAKGSLERAKMRLDKYCTLKTLMPIFFEKLYAKTDFGNLHEIMRCVIFPKFTEEYQRVMVVQPTGKPFDSTHFINFYRLCVILSEHIKAHDYSNGFVVICDYRAINLMDFIHHLDITELRQIVTLLTDGFGMRIKGIHIITTSKMVDNLVKVFRSVLSEKIGNRIYVHKTVDPLYEFMPKEILPEDIGGEERSIKTLQDEWLEILSSDEHVSYLKDMQKATTNESQRQKDKFNDQYMGIPGSFRAYSVD